MRIKVSRFSVNYLDSAVFGGLEMANMIQRSGSVATGCSAHTERIWPFARKNRFEACTDFPRLQF